MKQQEMKIENREEGRVFRRENRLDERQEQKLLQIEHNGYWMAFFGLFAAIVVQLALYDVPTAHIGGEVAVFLGMAVYMVVSCARNGIWDRHIALSAKANLAMALLAGGVTAGINFFIMMTRYLKPGGSAAVAVFTGAAAFVVTFLALTLVSRATKKRQEKLEEEVGEGER